MLALGSLGAGAAAGCRHLATAGAAAKVFLLSGVSAGVIQTAIGPIDNTGAFLQIYNTLKSWNTLPMNQHMCDLDPLTLNLWTRV